MVFFCSEAEGSINKQAAGAVPHVALLPQE
jgi:hypothetical protein